MSVLRTISSQDQKPFLFVHTSVKMLHLIKEVKKMSKKKTHEEFETEMMQIHGDEVILLTKYETNKTKVTVKYKSCGHIDQKMPTKLLIGQSCGICRAKRVSKTKTNTTEYYLGRLKQNGVNVTLLSEYTGLKNKVTLINNNCGHCYEAQAGNVVRGAGCPVCHGMKDTAEFKKQIEEKYPSEYEILGEYINNKTRIKVKHKCGHEWLVTPKSLLRAKTCPKCILSKGEAFISDYLTAKNAVFETQYKFDDCRNKNPLPFDFAVFVNGEIKLIEFDGGQHFGKSNYWGKQNKSDILMRDNIKNNYCNEKNIPLLRIPYWWLRTERIKQEITNFLGF